MKLPQIKQCKWNYLALAFAFPVVGMVILMIIAQCTPFGDRSMLYSDNFHQYYPFFVAYRKSLLSGESLLYTWNIGMGMDYLGLIAYYLGSPLYLLSVFVPENLTLQFFGFLVPVKLGFASLFFAVFLRKMFDKNDLSISLFGSFYSLCAWALGYQWNIMWLDTFALLPLVALGTVALLRDRKFFLYTVALFLAVLVNYYIGFFVCIFVLLVFICYQICRFTTAKRFFQDLCRIALFSALAIGMTAILELPAYAALQNTQSSVNAFPVGFKLNIADENTWKGLLDAMRQVAGNMGGGVSPSFKEGLPNLYCGVGSVMLAFLFLTSKDVKLRDKICSVCLLIFFMLSVIIRQLDYIWHGFHFTNMIPYRFTFLFSFVLLYMAYRAYLMREEFSTGRIFLAGLLSLLVFACSDDRFEPVFLLFNLIFLFLYIGAFIYGSHTFSPPKNPTKRKIEKFEKFKAQHRNYAALTLAGIMVLELILNIVNFGANFAYTTISNYPKGTEATASQIKVMEELEDSTLFYRAEFSHAQTLNDGALNGYNGISTFTSSANVKVTEFMRSLGYGAKNTYNRYCFEESSPVANLFLGLKYMLERDTAKANPYFDYVHKYETVTLLKNNAYLPLGFLANSQLANVDFSAAGDRFQFQNRLLTAASGIQGNFWTKLPGNALDITGKNATISNKSQTGYCSYTTSGSTGTITYKYTADRAGFLCLDLDLSKKNGYNIYINGTHLLTESYSLPQMISVCEITPGMEIEIRLNCKTNEKGSISIQAAVLNEDLFRSAYDVLAASTLELTTFENTLVEGTVKCDRDGLLYTSIPQNGNWTVTVDGAPAEIVLIGNAMIGVALTQGSHTVSIRYHNAAFSLGWKVSLLCLIAFLALVYWRYQPKLPRGKYEKA